jgi:hypothetical protein
MTANRAPAVEPPMLRLLEDAPEYSARAPLTFYERNPALEHTLTKQVSCMLLGDALICRGYWKLVYIEAVMGMPFMVLYWKDQPVYKVGFVSSDPVYRRAMFARIGRRLAEFGWDSTARLDKGGACWVSVQVCRRRLRRLV